MVRLRNLRGFELSEVKRFKFKYFTLWFTFVESKFQFFNDGKLILTKKGECEQSQLKILLNDGSNFFNQFIFTRNINDSGLKFSYLMEYPSYICPHLFKNFKADYLYFNGNLLQFDPTEYKELSLNSTILRLKLKNINGINLNSRILRKTSF